MHTEYGDMLVANLRAAVPFRLVFSASKNLVKYIMYVCKS